MLHGHGAKGGVLARLAGSALRADRYCVARLYTAHGGKPALFPILASGAVRAADGAAAGIFHGRLVFICEYERRNLYQESRSAANADATDLQQHQRAGFRADPTRSMPVHFIYVGMLRDLKGPDLSGRAFAKTERLIGRPLSALMIGDGPDRDRYREMMVERGLGEAHRHAARHACPAGFRHVAEPGRPSRAEAMPYIVLEGLAPEGQSSRPVSAAFPEALGKDSGALVAPDNADDLARVMADAVRIPEWHDKTMPPIEQVRSVFSLTVMANEVLELYRDLIRRPAAGAAGLVKRFLGALCCYCRLVKQRR